MLDPFRFKPQLSGRRHLPTLPAYRSSYHDGMLSPLHRPRVRYPLSELLRVFQRLYGHPVHGRVRELFNFQVTYRLAGSLDTAGLTLTFMHPGSDTFPRFVTSYPYPKGYMLILNLRLRTSTPTPYAVPPYLTPASLLLAVTPTNKSRGTSYQYSV